MNAPSRPILAVALALLPCPAVAEYEPGRAKVPEPRREFRAAWIATVHNIDWPSSNGLSPSQQRAELVSLLDLAAETGLNAVVLQVRTECDAFYDSKFEPWSFFLTGRMGAAPADGYDPLAFAVKEAHRRGIELHAWFNPFRSSATDRSSKSSDHISRTHPSLMLPAGSMKWANPASDFVRERAIDVMVDVTQRYDVDGIHIDDYFYPYPKTIDGKVHDQFDDSSSYEQYRSRGGKLGLRDWRRSNIDQFISTLYSSIKSTKPWVKVGISPFGIWRPGYPASIEAGLDSYDHISADSRKWLHRGWLDYLSPQLYWRIDPPEQSFTTLVKWWSQQNRQRRHLWPGIASNRISNPDHADRPAEESVRQIGLTRRYASPQGPGHVHWSIKALEEDRDELRSELRESYAETALPPASPWLGSDRPGGAWVAAVEEKEGLTLAFKPAEDARWRLIQVRDGRSWETLRLLPASKEHHHLDEAPPLVAVRNVGPTGLLSEPTVLRRQ